MINSERPGFYWNFLRRDILGEGWIEIGWTCGLNPPLKIKRKTLSIWRPNQSLILMIVLIIPFSKVFILSL